MGEVRCPRGHPVTSTRQVTPWVCDGNESGVHAVGRNRCDTCDYDLCDTCFAQKRSLLVGFEDANVTVTFRVSQIQSDHDLAVASIMASMLSLSVHPSGEVECLCGHPLRATNRRSVQWTCDGTRQPGGCQGGATLRGRNRCDICDFDLCDACHDSRREVKCPGNHLMNFTRQVHPTAGASGWGCDICRVVSDNSEPRFGCLLCNFDICNLCFGTNNGALDEIANEGLIDVASYQFESEKQKEKRRLLAAPVEEATPEEISSNDCCGICWTNKRMIVFVDCGHTSCQECCVELDKCHICRKNIKSKMRFYL